MSAYKCSLFLKKSQDAFPEKKIRADIQDLEDFVLKKARDLRGELMVLTQKFKGRDRCHLPPPTHPSVKSRWRCVRVCVHDGAALLCLSLVVWLCVLRLCGIYI